MTVTMNCLISIQADLQAAIGSNMLQLPTTFSQLAHSVHSLAALNTVPGNSYNYARPSKLQLRDGVALDCHWLSRQVQQQSF